MGEQVYAAVIGEVAGKAVSKVINALAKRPSMDEKLQRLEMLVIKLRGTVEMSERVGAETASLLQWRDKLRDAASRGHQVLLSFQRRADDGDDAAAAGERHGGGEGSVAVSFARDVLLGMARGVRSTATALLSCGECAVTFTRNTLLAMARGFRSATAVMLSCGELNSTVDRLEKTCADIGEFIKLLQVEASQANTVHKPTERKRTPIKSAREPIENVGVAGNGKKEKNRQREEDAARLQDVALPLEEVRLFQEDAAADKDALADALAMSTAVQRLQDALAEISRAVAVADGSGLADLEWLAELAQVLREERQQGHAAIDDGNAKASNKQQGGRPGSAVSSKKEKQLPGVDEKLQRLEMLVVMLRSTVEVSERLGAETASLLQWRDKLREAASKGHQVLLSFQRRLMGADAAMAGVTKEHRGAGGKSGVVSFVTKALLGMEKGVEIVITESLFDGEVAMKLNCLNSTVDRLEKVCADDVGDFIKLLQVEASRVKSLHMTTRTTQRKKSKFQTAMEHTEKVDVSENLLLQDSSVSREDDGLRSRRKRKSFVSSSSSEEEDCSVSVRTKGRLTGLFSSLSSSSKEKEETCSRSGRIVRGFFSSSPSLPSAKEDSFRSSDRSFIPSPSEDWIGRRGFFVGDEEEEEDEAEERRRRRLARLLFSLSSSSTPSSSSSLSSPSPPSSSSEHEGDGGGGAAAVAAMARAMPSAVVRFQAALAEITRGEEMAGGRDLKGMEWMATWAHILRDATQRGRAVRIRIYSDSKDGKQANGEGEHEARQLCNAVHIVENLALDVGCFISLVLLCPSSIDAY